MHLRAQFRVQCEGEGVVVDLGDNGGRHLPLLCLVPEDFQRQQDSLDVDHHVGG